MFHLPLGTVTFLFTDIEGSTRLAREHPESWETARARHHAILRGAIDSNHGYVFQIIGDAFCAAFHTAGDALQVAVKAQLDLNSEDWGDTPIKVRMGIHTGKAEIRENGEYHGYLAMSRVQRLMSAGHGGQVLVSAASQELLLEDLPAEVSLRDLGERRLKDLIRPEHIYQVVIPGLPVDFPPLKTLDVYRHNLPVQLTSFIGRRKEMQEIEQAMVTHRLVTLTGVGGTGKTRLALQVAADLLDQFPHGAWFIELAALTSPELIPQTILSAIQIPEQPGMTALQQLQDYLREKNILLILDNCEHLLEECARLVEMLLSQAPDLKVMVTSREALGVQGEVIWPVPSLSLPAAGQISFIEQLSGCEAAQLFVERATLVQPHFQVTSDNAPTVAQICLRLDGIPLAIELAAARVRAMSVDQISLRLDDRFRLLTGGRRTRLERHQTLRATLDWSYNLLSAEEKLLLSRLSVFMGGWTLEAAEQVCDLQKERLDFLDLLTHLVDKSLVLLDGSRYRMLETTRQYAREKLLESDEGKTLRDRHLVCFLALAEQGSQEIHGPNQLEWMDRLEMDHDNFRSALEWCAAEHSNKEALRLLNALAWPWTRRDHSGEINNWFDVLRVLPDIRNYPELYARLLNHIGQYGLPGQDLRDRQTLLEESRTIWLKLGVDGEQGLAEALRALGEIELLLATKDLQAAESLYQESLRLYQKHANKGGTARVMLGLGYKSVNEGRYAEAEQYYRQSMSLYQEIGDTYGLAFAFSNLGEYYRFLGDYHQAEKFHEQSLEIVREFGGRLALAWPFLNLGWVSLRTGNYEKARMLFVESLKLFLEIGDKDLTSLAGLASVLGSTGRSEQAAQLFGALDLFIKNSRPFEAADEKDFTFYLATVREQLDSATFENAWMEGYAMTLDQAVAFALEQAGQ